jgi:hypothetical protein
MTLRHFWIWAVLLAALFWAPGARAQGTGFGRAQDAIDVTERRIELADALIPDTPSTPATNELALARQIQSRARSALAGGQYAIAERTTLEARAHADRAIAIVRGLPDPDRVLIQVERTSEIVDRARERLGDCGEDRARALLRVGQEMQQRAMVAVDESRYLAALQLTMSARERILKAMRLCNVTETLSETASRALRRTDDVISRAREAADHGGSEEAVRALGHASSIQDDARAEFDSGHYEASLRLTQSARLIALRIARRAPRPGSPGRSPAAGSRRPR